MRKAVLTTGILWAVVGVTYLIKAFQLDMGTLDKPGAGVYPVFVGFLLMVAAIGTIAGAIGRPPAGTIAWPKGIGLGRILGIAAVIFFYAFALEFLGYLVCGSVVLLVCLHVMGMRSWAAKIGLTVSVMALSFFLFDTLLRVPLPEGILAVFWGKS